ncbi:glycosyltransferase family protein [Pseudoalteromonas piscicida]|uniref:Polysaccharide biosynthesis protein n=2 Tax=Pseudoalteromonas piscicida TaxID=43662 RepID=A0AAD0W492_PSEO7|nr:glycosyltransferase family protein [Pseudoalteromonas piscicida]ASD67480.1 polysaccharide biosynthesis protein [Pseudoalteromonas piscicida]AXR01818.1 polysaccharide biosynthesis protein [Pseudoalteromonas piscicida]WPU32611.1 glycosyltransferase family protein [Pseudoalteromonas piscicida]
MKDLQIIIQARMTSSRLPGKVMLPLCNSSVLQVMLDRLGDLVNNVVIATTDDGTEQPIVDLCRRLNIKYFRGSTENVLSRYYLAARHYGAQDNTAIVRLTSDCPLIDSTLVRLAIDYYQNHNVDMVSLGPHSGFPRGLDTCVFAFRLLARTHELAHSAPDKEHVTLGMPKFNTINSHTISAGEDNSHYRLTLDEPDDYTAIQAIYLQFNNNLNFSYSELLETLKNHPHLADINKHVEQKTV